MHRISHKKAIYTLNDGLGWAKSLRWGLTCTHMRSLPPISTNVVPFTCLTFRKITDICEIEEFAGLVGGLGWGVMSRMLENRQGVAECRAGHKWNWFSLRWRGGWLTSLVFLLEERDLK